MESQIVIFCKHMLCYEVEEKKECFHGTLQAFQTQSTKP